MGKMKRLSRPKRWAAAVEKAQEIFSEIEAKISDLEGAMSDLREIKEEYEEWRGNLPDSLSSSALADKLDAMINLEFDEPEIGNLESIQGQIEEAEGADLPLGFGRD